MTDLQTSLSQFVNDTNGLLDKYSKTLKESNKESSNKLSFSGDAKQAPSIIVLDNVSAKKENFNGTVSTVA